MEDIVKSKAMSVYRGRKKSIDVAVVPDLKNECVGATEIARNLGIVRTGVYCVLQQQYFATGCKISKQSLFTAPASPPAC